MDEPELVFRMNDELIVNFGVFAGREATQAEVERLGDALLEEFESFEIVTERRIGFNAESRAAVHRVRIELEDGSAPDGVIPLVEAWAQDCLTERQAVQP